MMFPNWFWGTLLFCSAGCSFTVVSEAEHYDRAAAEETLSSALDAWRDGNVKVLIELTPPIRFVDDDILAGFHLVDYEYRQRDLPVRPFQGVPVTLTLKQGNGASITREAWYQVSLDPARAVLRSDP
jgi:hypothetical protein